MTVPTIRGRIFPNATATTAVDTASERKGSITSQYTWSTGSGNEANFGTIDISAGAANSAVLHGLIDWTADGGNTLVQDFKIWFSTRNFAQAGSVLKFRALNGADNASPTNTQAYVNNATTSSYTFSNMPTSEPGSINLYPTAGTTSMALSTTSADALMFAMYLAIASGETTGTYSGTTASYGLQLSHKYTYS